MSDSEAIDHLDFDPEDDEPDHEGDDLPYLRTWVDPPDGWHWVGTFANDATVDLEYSTALGEDGLPLFERPIPKDD
jgi:hypothetical protein